MSVVQELLELFFEHYVFVLAIILGYLFLKSRKKYENLPPGPMGLPLVGYLPFLTDEPHLKFMQLAKKYGNVISLRLGSKLVVVCNDYQSIRESTAKDAFLDRPESSVLESFDKLIPNVSSLNGIVWRDERRFMLHSLRDMGMGRHDMELFIKECIQEVIETYEMTEGKPVNVREVLMSSISGVICAKALGKKFDHSSSRRKELNQRMGEVIDVAGPAGILTFLPKLAPIIKFFNRGKYMQAFQSQKKIGEFFESEIDSHVQTLDDYYSRDFIDMYLKEMENRKKTGEEVQFDKDTLRGEVAVLFFAGTETSTSSIQWQLLILADRQDIQEKIYKEIVDVIGTERLVNRADQKDMPYTTAFIMEQQRWATLAPLGIFRSVSFDTTFQSYNIPKDTILFNNLWAMHHDPKYFTKPDEIRPERFLDENGKLKGKIESYGPFAFGRRMCPGELLANIEMFLYIASLVQHFKVASPPGQKVDYTASKGETGTRYPLMNKLCMIKREH